MDVLAAIALLVVAAAVGLAFAARRTKVGYARVERDGGSVLLDPEAMNAAYWALQPLCRACVKLGVPANAVTLGSLALSLGAGALLAFGHFGLGAVVTTIAALGDALDGLVARATGTTSRAGELLDSAADRYAELFFLGGLALHYRTSAWTLAVVLGAILASFMVSYASAKAEALGVPAPRGAMRRAERATYLVIGAVLVPFASMAFDRGPWWAREAPMIAALVLVATVGNVSAFRRLQAVARGATTPGAEPEPHPLLNLGRHQIGSMLVTIVDFGTMTLLVETGVATPVRATLVAATIGGVVNFVIGRNWIFYAAHDHPLPQAARYAAVSAVSAALNTAGEHLVHDQAGVQYQLARAVVSVTVSVVWNFPLQRHFVFRAPPPSARGQAQDSGEPR